MMNIHYISPSLLPSRSANSVHVALQCEGLVRAGAKVALYAKRTLKDANELPSAIRAAYGIDLAGIDLKTCFSPSERGNVARIAWFAMRSLPSDAGAILSRNVYASFLLAVLKRRPILFETHQLEIGPRKALQRAIMTQPWVTTVLISRHLERYLIEHHGTAPTRTLILHDGARDGIIPVSEERRRSELGMGAEWDAVCGYFGHLYPGRGIEIIEAMARARPRCLFLVYGGNPEDITARRQTATMENLRFMGHVPHQEAMYAMARVDVLLMPYQASVSIGVSGHDTARWMSPMKMFEYMAAGVPLISSDLPVLREVLDDRRNARLAMPENPGHWVAALDELLADPATAARIGRQAHADYRDRYSWTRRAEALIAALKN